MHGWQSESTDGPKGGWSCAFWSGCSGHLTHNCWMYCSVVVVVVVVVIIVVVVVVFVVVVEVYWSCSGPVVVV